MTTLCSLKLMSYSEIEKSETSDYSRMSKLKRLILPEFSKYNGSGMAVGSDLQFAFKLPPQVEVISSDLKTLVELSKNTSQISFLESIDIKLASEPGIPELMAFLSSPIDCTKIKSVSFGYISENSFDKILSVLERCQNLEELTIHCSETSQKSFEKLLVILKPMIHLEKLRLNKFITTVFYTLYFQSLKCLPSLKYLSLGLIFDFKDGSCDLNQFESLKSLELEYWNEEGTEICLPKGLNFIANTLESLTLLILPSHSLCNLDVLYSLSHLKYVKAPALPITLSDEEIQAKFLKLKYLKCK